MKRSTVLAKIVPLRNKKDKTADDKLDSEMASPPAIDGLVKLQTTRKEDDATPTASVKPPPGSRSASAPASVSGNAVPESPIDWPERRNSSSGHHRLMRRSQTVELVENTAYRPVGGPEYVKILVKYKLLKEDKHQGLVVARFVNAGSRQWRKPEIIKVEQFSANGNQEYLAEVTIGTSSNPPQTLRLDLDTGSSDFWVFSTLYRPKRLEGGPVHREFNPTKSPTWQWPPTKWGGFCNPFSFQRRPLTWDIEYGDGSSASGVVGFDQVEIGNMKIQKQAVQLASSINGPQFIQGTADGILGLGFGNLNSVQPKRVQTPLENMITQGIMHESLFTVSFNPQNSFYSFGFVDEETRAGRDFHYVDVDQSQGYWNFNSRYARIGDKVFRRTAGMAIADTGSSIILTHPHLVWKLYNSIDGAFYDSRQPGWVYPEGATVPEVAFSVGNDQSVMIYIDKDNMRHSDLGSGFIFGAIQENPAYNAGGRQFDIFGTPFLRQVYAVFDIRGRRFGVIKESQQPMFSRYVCDSPVSLEGSTRSGHEEEDPEIEDSIDGSILEEYPRRSSTVDSSRLASPIPKVPEAIPEEPTAVEDEAAESERLSE